MTQWKVLSSGFLIKQLFFEKSHFLHPHAQKPNQKLRKSFTFALKKSKKIQKFHFSKNASRWLLVTPNGFLSTPKTPRNHNWMKTYIITMPNVSKSRKTQFNVSNLKNAKHRDKELLKRIELEKCIFKLKNRFCEKFFEVPIGCMGASKRWFKVRRVLRNPFGVSRSHLEAFEANWKKKFEIHFLSCFYTLRAERNGIVSAC